MGIFSRKNASDREVEVDIEPTDEVAIDDSADSADVPSDRATEQEQPVERTPAERVDRSRGPFDRSETDEVDEHLDLGALALRPSAGTELRLDVDEQGQQITGVTAVQGESAVQMQVFAAPKTSGVWKDIRHEIADNLISAGGTADEYEGELGTELHARMPSRGADGRTTYSPVRFVGVDGPRWFLRAVLSGRAAVEDQAAEQMLEVVRSVVVTRGTEARAPRELLELTIPQDLLAAQQQAEEPQTGDDLRPFERGPEITEVR
ncbi:DUF3710 domain-containing protein [Luteipulveratus flavus]|uniref:DUF3710 domain-containing protein n=1 Tax=Luteipulveratus flavus TaxID=3031728 RepID=A0ABT6CAD2_9MICO|nr:DUF3710 domain-containing protein [Luteipulveratus sp. YIM 133296]MDF8265838.1 DUF3710 domain-containing protein [Luteipulveratus sp. YIM 133296]